MERVEIKHEFVEEKEVMWKSCCLRTDRQAVVYLGQLSFSLSVLGISCAMLIIVIVTSQVPMFRSYLSCLENYCLKLLIVLTVK